MSTSFFIGGDDPHADSVIDAQIALRSQASQVVEIDRDDHFDALLFDSQRTDFSKAGRINSLYRAASRRGANGRPVISTASPSFTLTTSWLRMSASTSRSSRRADFQQHGAGRYLGARR